MKTIFARLMKDESGATAIEYGLIAALISVALISGAGMLGTALDDQFEQISKELDYTAGGAAEE
ncbi:Flp family type IVb pilin [Sinorhizobium meliloti WSM1022]|jgi:pilus assembly protein Flp/PilA|uniref:Flp family type IVb pilin n=1 Tax=Rhizobium meliloti TaxID=382 RepID=UPI00040AA0D8|nr:Flp family type IVb pilin [Sinorhizobium meliloti]ASQ05479.1 Flp family type IVb pilin [Sinorhizobium meliloti]MCO6422890.1 Flp family type IVb pilin [Sinorhizobium meliloti]MDW9411045.1 Flp family type IVb pilin [Sinorhizobium meliloti]MDW9443329.1 Flp family type IVb pilin [Sinorhizobium meliloti]MDW9456206.1 Flp family type IVb pilin [Sinorhizobium meliloti]